MDLIESIRVFRRVAETKSFSAVAREREVSQPSISKIIQNLESDLGVTLMRRTTRGLSLTVEGQKLYNMGGDLVDRAEELLAQVRNQKLNLTGEIRISTSLAFARLILAEMLAEFTTENPDLKLSFLLQDGYIDLVENRVDLAVRIGDLPDSGLKAYRLGTSRRCLYASREYLKEHRRPRDLAGLRRHRLLYYTRLADRPAWPLLNEKGESAPFIFEPFFKTDGSDLLRECVLQGLGIALLPTWMMRKPESEKSVERLFPQHAPAPSPIYALSASTSELTAKQKVLVDFLRRKFEKIPELAMR